MTHWYWIVAVRTPHGGWQVIDSYSNWDEAMRRATREARWLGRKAKVWGGCTC